MADTLLTLDPFSWIDLEEMRREHRKPVTEVVPTPLATWNAACRGEGGGQGIAKGWLVTVAGKPGTGKSALALNASHHAIRGGRTVAFLSYEMSRAQLLTRFIAIATGIELRQLERGPQFDAEAFVPMMHSLDKAGLLNKLFLAERPRRDLAGLAELLQQAVDMGCQLAVVDYVQLIGRREYPGIFERTQAVSALLQQTAFELGITVLALSQFNRSALAQRTEEPGIEALKGGSLDEDADQVILLDYSKFERTATGAITNLIIGKNRHGPMPKIPVAWDFRTLRIEELPERDRYTTSRMDGGPRP